MSRYRQHTHYCLNKSEGCTSTFLCDGPLERNHDGWPEVICMAQPEDTFECDECRAGRCEDCGALINLGQPHDARCDFQQQVATAEGEGMTGQ